MSGKHQQRCKVPRGKLSGGGGEETRKVSKRRPPKSVIPYQGEDMNIRKEEGAGTISAKINIKIQVGRLMSPGPVWCLKGTGVTSAQFRHTHDLTGIRGNADGSVAGQSQNC